MRSAVIHLISQINKTSLSNEEILDLQKYVNEYSIDDWNDLFKLIQFNAVQVLSYKNLVKYQLLENLPLAQTIQLEVLRNEVQGIVARNEKRNFWTKKIIDSFKNENIKLILLKGAYLGPEIYGDQLYKKMNDVDLLLDVKDLTAGKQILNKLGFISIGEIFSTLSDSDKINQTHHTPPFIETNGECVTGIHWNIISPFSSIKINSANLIKRAILNEDGKSWGLTPEDNLLHLCIHLPFYKTGLRELADVSNLILNKKIDWELFVNLVRKSSAQFRVFRVLSLAKKMISFPIPIDVIERFRADSDEVTISATDALTNDLEKLFTSRSTYMGKIEKYFIVFKISTLWTEKLYGYLMMWVTLLFVPKVERKKMGCSFLSAPIFLWGALSLDHGDKALVLTTIANLIEMIKFTMIYPFHKRGISLKNHPHFHLLKILE